MSTSTGDSSQWRAPRRWVRCTHCGASFETKLDRAPAHFRARFETLSDREREVLLRIARGVMPADIAAELGIDARTVATFRYRLMKKMELSGTAAIAVAVYKAGLLE